MNDDLERALPYVYGALALSIVALACTVAALIVELIK